MNFNDMNGIGNSQNASNVEQNFKDAYQRYANKSEDELMSELLSKANSMKEQGLFDINSLEKLYATASPLLNEAQQKKMRSVIDALKG